MGIIQFFLRFLYDIYRHNRIGPPRKTAQKWENKDSWWFLNFLFAQIGMRYSFFIKVPVSVFKSFFAYRRVIGRGINVSEFFSQIDYTHSLQIWEIATICYFFHNYKQKIVTKKRTAMWNKSSFRNKLTMWEYKECIDNVKYHNRKNL